MSRNVAFLFATLILAIWIGWTFFLLFRIGYDFRASSLHPFEITGQFGDSFGVLASLMSALALVGALYSIHVQNENYYRQQFESNFYSILNSIKEERLEFSVAITGDIISHSISSKVKYYKLRKAIRSDSHRFFGNEAFAVQLYRIRDKIGPGGFNDSKNVARLYREVFIPGSRIGNYFRLLYHLYSMLDQSNVRDKVFYSRIIRAHITSSEMCLLAYNCAIDEGRHKFKRLIEKYSALHNIKRENLDEYEKAELKFFQFRISEKAFRFDELDYFKY